MHSKHSLVILVKIDHITLKHWFGSVFIYPKRLPKVEKLGSLKRIIIETTTCFLWTPWALVTHSTVNIHIQKDSWCEWQRLEPSRQALVGRRRMCRRRCHLGFPTAPSEPFQPQLLPLESGRLVPVSSITASEFPWVVYLCTLSSVPCGTCCC